VSRDYKIRGYTVGQSPNPPLWVAFGALLASLLADAGSTAEDISSAVLYVALSIWAYGEAVRGVNLFRRSIGVIGLALVVFAVARGIG
jgi:hypothetical protein